MRLQGRRSLTRRSLCDRSDAHPKRCVWPAVQRCPCALSLALGLALLQEVPFVERNGRSMNPSLAEHHMPGHGDVPEIDIL